MRIFDDSSSVARLATFAAVASAALLGAPEALRAQTRLEPGETEVKRGAPPEREEEQTATEQRPEETKDPDGEANSEERPRPGVEQFEKKSRKRVRPDALPPPSASETDMPDVLRNNNGKLPEPPSMESLQETGEHVRKRVFELVSIQQPKAPGDTSPIVHRGHAVVVGGGDDGPPFLITTYVWLEDSDELYLVPRSLSNNGRNEDDSQPTAERRSLDAMTVDGRAQDWLDEHRDELVRARLFKPDRHRNLVAIVPDTPSRLDLPQKGLDLFDLDQESPARLYGYTPKSGNGLEQAELLDSHPDAESLVYYLQTTYTVVFGAPIVGTDGELLVLTAFQHPNTSGRVLAVPPKPIAAYIDDVLATVD